MNKKNNSKKRHDDSLNNQLDKRAKIDQSYYLSGSETETDYSDHEERVSESKKIALENETSRTMYFKRFLDVTGQRRELKVEYMFEVRKMFNDPVSPFLLEASKAVAPFSYIHNIIGHENEFSPRFIQTASNIKLNPKRVIGSDNKWVWELVVDVNDIEYLIKDFKKDLKKLGTIIANDRFIFIIDKNSSRISSESPAYICDAEWSDIVNQFEFDETNLFDYGTQLRMAAKFTTLMTPVMDKYHSRYSLRELFSLYVYCTLNFNNDEHMKGNFLYGFVKSTLPPNSSKPSAIDAHCNKQVTQINDIFDMFSGSYSPLSNHEKNKVVFDSIRKVATNYINDIKEEDMAVAALSSFVSEDDFSSSGFSR